MDPYAGMTTDASMPRRCKARGSAPITSASPPVLANGTASDAAMTTRIRNVPPACGGYPRAPRRCRTASACGITLMRKPVPCLRRAGVPKRLLSNRRGAQWLGALRPRLHRVQQHVVDRVDEDETHLLAH